MPYCDTVADLLLISNWQEVYNDDIRPTVALSLGRETELHKKLSLEEEKDAWSMIPKAFLED